MESAAKIKEILQAASMEKLPEFIAEYENDPRSGVQKLVSSAQKKIDALEKERQRIENLKKYEKEYAQYTYICGIDEVGRGPLAGPVVAGAVILPKDCDILYINDSKQLSEKKREELYDVITKEAVAWAVGYASPERIDEINILQATYGHAGGCRQTGSGTGSVVERCCDDSRSGDPTGADHQGRCQEHFYRCGQYCGQGDQGPSDGAVCRCVSGV